MQRIIDSNDNEKQLFTFIESIFDTEEQLIDIMHDETCNSQLFNLAQGLVSRCHLVHYKQIPSNDLLTDKDAIIFNFHEAVFDFPSMNVFLHDLDKAYKTNQLSRDDDNALRYLDCKYEYFFLSIQSIIFVVQYSDAAIEQEMLMTGASMFWLDTLHDCHLDRSLPLPYDRYRFVDEHRTGRATSVSFDFSQDLSHHFLAYASLNEITLEYLVLTCYYTFLFKLTNGEKDLCIGMNTHGRYKEELMLVIGMFVNAIPLRCQLDPQWSFDYLMNCVQEIVENSVKYSYFPLQRILAQHPRVSKAVFLDTSFVFYSNESHNIANEIMISDSRLHSMPILIKISESEIMSKFDFALTIQCNLSTSQLSCTIDASLDLFNEITVDKIAQRFHSMLEQLFTRTDVQMNKPIYEFSLILLDEKLLMQSMNNTQVLFPPALCIHHEFVCQVMKHPQKLAVELDDQSLTYSELLHYVHVLSLNLLKKQRVIVGEIVCQCVERSLSMVS
jgi:fengycin family lipopeptide synthetase D